MRAFGVMVVVVGLFALAARAVLGDSGPNGGERARGAAVTPQASAASTATLAPQPVPTVGPGRLGFSEPKAITPAGAEVGDPRAVVSPTGSAAVLWRTVSGLSSPKTYEAHYVAAIGPEPGRLAKARVITGATSAARETGEQQLIALPDGGFAACFDESGRRKGRATTGCTFAPPGGWFGPLRVIERVPWQRRSTMSAYAQPGGGLLLLLAHTVPGRKRAFALRTLAADGTLGPKQSLGTTASDRGMGLAVLDDGTVAVSTATGSSDAALEGELKPSLRLRAPGAKDFGPPVTFTTDQVNGAPGLTGGARLLVDYASGPEADDTLPSFVQMQPGGTFTPPKTVPRPGKGFLFGYALPLPDGSALGIAVSQTQAETDCGEPTSGAVGVGPLVDLPAGAARDGGGTDGPVTAQRLSDPKQIALSAPAAVTADGTVIVAWDDSYGQDGKSRVEVAIRRAGKPSFAAPQLLPRDTANGGVIVAAGGDQAMLAWTTGEHLGPSQIVVSALRTAAPYARQQPRPAKPQAACN